MTDDNLSPSSRSLLEAARPGLGPDAEVAKRMRAKIAASVGAGAGIATVAAVKSGLAAKLAIVSAVVLVGVGAAVFALSNTDDEVRAPAVTPSVSEPLELPGSAHHVEREPQREVHLPAIDARPTKIATPTTPVVTPAKPAKPSLAREVELVDQAMTALRSKDFRAALGAVATYRSETAGAGQLAQDAAAIEVEALCGARDPSGPTKLAAFEVTYPSSAQHARLEEACK